MTLEILIIEGNPAPSLDAARETGFAQAHETYRDALGLHAPEAAFTTLFALAPERNANEIDFARFDGFALTGSGVPWPADAEEARPYRDLVEQLFATGKPVVGSCWGPQAAAIVLGGRVGANPHGSEIGVARDIELTKAGKQHWGFAGMPDRFDQPAIHRDHITVLPSKAQHLARNAVCEFQAFSFCADGIDFLGFQPHPEFELGYIQTMFETRPVLPGTIQALTDFPDEPSRHVADPHERTRVLGNWLDHVRERRSGSAAR